MRRRSLAAGSTYWRVPNPMKLKRLFGTAFVLSSVLAGIVAFSPRAAHSTDLQDSTTLVNHPAADINDVYMFPAPDNAANVVLMMDVDAGLTSASGASFDPAVLYQFKIAHGTSAGAEDTVIQFLPSSTGTGQTLTMFGPNVPNIVGTTSTVLSPSISSGKAIPFGGTSTPLTVSGFGSDTSKYTVTAYAGPIADPSFFDLARFYQLFPDRNYKNQSLGAAATPGPTLTTPPGFNVSNCGSSPTNFFASTKALAIIIEMPKALLEDLPTGSTASATTVHLWATTSTVNGS
jgi:hypothetical protein